MTGVAAVCLDPAVLGQLMPLYLRLGADGTVHAAGPTMAKLFGAQPLIGGQFFDLFDLRRPGGITDMAALLRSTGRKLHLSPRGPVATPMRGLAVPLAREGGLLVNLGFGIGVIEAVRRHALTDADFAPSDLAVELLYVVEAKSAVMRELRDLNLRLQDSKSAAEEQALTDTLTGLRNRRALDMALTRLAAAGGPFGVMHLDLDYFKAVNDTLGHAAGDHVLREVALVLRAEFRNQDTVARVGGDEFVVLLPGMADGAMMMQIAQRLIGRLAGPISYEGRECRIAASVGMALSTDYLPLRIDQMLNDADQALYAAKREGRSCARLHRPLQGPQMRAG